MIENGPLPDGTRIKTTIGGVKTGRDRELADYQLITANRIMENNLRFWVTGWADLHADLIIPANVRCAPTGAIERRKKCN